MSDFDNINPDEELPEEPTPSFDDAFTSMESALDSLPTGSFYTIRHESNAPVYVPAYTSEDGTPEAINVRQVCERRGLTLGANVNAYVDGNPIALDSIVAAGSVITLVGNVKGGR